MYDLIVIGAGPGGYVCAIRAAQLGLSVACIEKEADCGGTCLRVGCIPSKALLESSEHYHRAKQGLDRHGIKVGQVELNLGSMMRRKDTVVKTLTKGVDMLLKKNKVERFVGQARLVAAPGKGETQVEVGGKGLAARYVVIATGSVSAVLPGVDVDGDRVGTSTEALAYKEVPAHLVVIGAGAIGLELGSVWARLGSRVSVVEFLDRILPGTDAELAQAAQRLLERQGLEFHLSQRVTSARHVGGGHCLVEAESLLRGDAGTRAPEGGQRESGLRLECDRVLLAVGRKPNTEGLGAEALGLAMERGRITVDAQLRTNVPGIYAIGDVIAGPMLAHKAEEEGVAVAEFLATGRGHVNYDAIPAIVYTHPELATVGKCPEDLDKAGIPYKVGVFPFAGNGRARSIGEVEGMVKVVAHAHTDRILGVHILGPRAGDLIAECVVAMDFSASSEDLARICHAHPTLSEAVREASLAVDGRAIHI